MSVFSGKKIEKGLEQLQHGSSVYNIQAKFNFLTGRVTLTNAILSSTPLPPTHFGILPCSNLAKIVERHG